MTSPTRQTITQTVGDYIEALNRADPAALTALFSDDARHQEPIGSEPLRGTEQIHAFFRRATDPNLRVRQLAPITVHGAHAAVQLAVFLPGLAEFATTDIFEIDDVGRITSLIAIPDLDAHTRESAQW